MLATGIRPHFSEQNFEEGGAEPESGPEIASVIVGNFVGSRSRSRQNFTDSDSDMKWGNNRLSVVKFLPCW